LHQETGTTFVFVTHDQAEALALSSRVAIFDHGELLQVGAPREVYERPASRFVAEFLGEIISCRWRRRRAGRWRGDGALEDEHGVGAARRPDSPGPRPLLAIRPSTCRLALQPPPGSENGLSRRTPRRSGSRAAHRPQRGGADLQQLAMVEDGDARGERQRPSAWS